MLIKRDPSFFTIPRGVLRLARVEPNPARSPDAGVYVLVGDATSAPIEAIWPEEGVDLPCQRAGAAEPFRLTVVHLNDLHGHIVDFTAQGPQPVFARMASHIRALRTRSEQHAHRGLLVLSGGDDAVGSVFDALLGDSPERFQLHAAYRLYTAAGIDACVLGNHDLDFGARLLATALRANARFPLLSANLAGCAWLSSLCFPAALFVIKGVRVAVIGLTTPAQIAPQPDSTLNLGHPATALHNLLPALSTISDVTLVLSHLGYSLASSSAGVLLAGDVELAQTLQPGSIQAIIGGHTHHVLNEQGVAAHNIVNGVPILQAGKFGEFLGQAEIAVNRTCAAVTSARLLSTHLLPEDVAFTAAEVTPLLRAIEPVFVQDIGTVADDPALGAEAVRNDFAAGESPLANFVADALAAQCRCAGYAVDLAMVDASAMATGVPKGRLHYDDWFAVMPFADTVRIYTMTGAALLRLVAENAYRVDRPDEPHTERGFLHFSREVRYCIRLGQSRWQATAEEITVGGHVLAAQPERSFAVACSSFLHMPAATWQREAASRRPYGLLDLCTLPAIDTHLFLRHHLLDYIVKHGGVTATSGARRDGRLVIVE